MILQLMDINL